MPSSSVNPNPMPINNDLHSLSSASPDLSNHHTAPPLPPHNYANMPINKNPLPPPRNDDQRFNRFSRPNYQRFSVTTDQSSADERNQVADRLADPFSYNDTQTLRADQKLNY